MRDFEEMRDRKRERKREREKEKEREREFITPLFLYRLNINLALVQRRSSYV